MSHPQFSVRSLLVLTAVIAMACAAWSATVNIVGVIYAESLAMFLMASAALFAGRCSRVLTFIGFSLLAVAFFSGLFGDFTVPKKRYPGSGIRHNRSATQQRNR
jgi:hypothetical protein